MDEDLKGRPVGACDLPDLIGSFFYCARQKAFVCSRSFISQCMIGILVVISNAGFIRLSHILYFQGKIYIPFVFCHVYRNKHAASKARIKYYEEGHTKASSNQVSS